jgi:hypothetical protein
MPMPGNYEQQLVEAKRHVAESLRHIEDQRIVIRQLERDGHDITQAKELLSELVEAQNLHQQNLQRVLRELGGSSV